MGRESVASASEQDSLGKIGAAEASLVPGKKVKLAEEEDEQQPQRQEGPFLGLA
ncbi:Immediate early response 2 protein-like [Crotalus adamanteus]|uniref:Immediate early response 2 protein-like n=1 Tax=Crotalus adamanteus TaxID=8729 RepID=A0AAW1C0Y1_CROAD